MDRLSDLINDTFQMRETGEDKVISLAEAIQRYVHPNQTIHVGATHCCSNSAILEIARQFHGKNPQFTLVMRGIRDTVMILLHLGLLKKVITAFSGNVYPYYGPNPVTQKAYTSGRVQLEDWSILTFPQMLMAGALGTGFTPTLSIVGSSMEKDNGGSFRVVDDPFGTGRKIGMLKALNPDISIVHGLAADRAGNIIIAPPYSESVWGAKASKGGVVATAERLVPADFIRQHSDMVKVPAHMVRSVSVVPMGAHPNGVWNQGVEEIDAYAEDYTFMTEFNQVCRDPSKLDAWIKDWVLDCRDFDDYLAKLGSGRVMVLKGSADRDAWRYQFDAVSNTISQDTEFNETEMMVVAAAREIRESVVSNHSQTILAGAGTANLAAWMSKYQLAGQGVTVELMVELGYFGNSPRPTEPFVLNFGNFPTCKMLTETLDTLGVYTCGATNQCMGVLGGGQVDRFGNINSTWMSKDLYLTGSGGANDVASGARNVIIVMTQSKRRFLEQVPYITAPGINVRKLVSSMGVFEKLGDDRDLTLTKYFAGKAPSKDESIRQIKENCGWDLKVSGNPVEVPIPNLDELLLLRVFDPNKYYIK